MDSASQDWNTGSYGRSESYVEWAASVKQSCNVLLSIGIAVCMGNEEEAAGDSG